MSPARYRLFFLRASVLSVVNFKLTRAGLRRLPQAEVLAIHTKIERHFFGQIQTVLRHMSGTFGGSQDAIAGPNPTGANIVEPLVRLLRMNLVGGEENLTPAPAPKHA